jgi:nucleotide-binding universal stress UspA family protein
LSLVKAVNNTRQYKMTYGEFLVPISGANDDEKILQRVAKFHQSFATPITLFYAEPDPTDILVWSADGMVAGANASVIESFKRSSQEVWDKILVESAKFKDFNLERECGILDSVLPERAALCDLMVVSDFCACGKSSISSAFEEALMHNGIPALILHDRTDFDFSNIAIAWDGSPQAARAVKAAMPFLKAAKYVTILHVLGGATQSRSLIKDPQKLRAKLANHGIEAEVLVQDIIGKSVGDTILSLVNKLDVELLVAGAYGHSRAREFVFGGVTKSMLRCEDGPHLLISH